MKAWYSISTSGTSLVMSSDTSSSFHKATLGVPILFYSLLIIMPV